MKTLIKKILTKHFARSKTNVDYLPESLRSIVEENAVLVAYLSEKSLKERQINKNDVIVALHNFIQHYSNANVSRLPAFFNADRVFVNAWVDVFKDYTPAGMRLDAAFFERRNRTTLRGITCTALDNACFGHGTNLNPLQVCRLAEELLM